ncbi:hypothetical protein GCM10027275_21850 [Rhabdobacter roseus]|uniref:Metallophosphoesterase n=1 Tax=Rhabdobacter roseus TaxID=1655419 RepID=A0A840TKT2_9BACT|nr:metallophosphoesterase family protein [Rhabdobacter roseus]MBB5284121.1 hypothetical protein [Rhabdobacter roseus]
MNKNQKMGKGYFALVALGLLYLTACQTPSAPSGSTVKDVMDAVVTRLYESLTPAQLDTISQAYLLATLTAEEKKVLATRYWTFEVDQPVTVSLMRHVDQKVVPFWLPESGFQKTDMVVRNEEYTYEVWQKNFEKGSVKLGINGFDKHRPVYFITVGPQSTSGGAVKISGIFPENQHLDTMRLGAFTYHDWDELVLTEVPEPLVGHTLFTTIRGRAREAHVVGAFRETKYPSSARPDQVLLSWSDDPARTVAVQWRTHPSVADGEVLYWLEGTSDTLRTSAAVYKMEDRLLRNDRYVHRFTAQLKNLTPGTTYHYRVGSKQGEWSETASFKTAAQGTSEPFSFIWFGDTHKSPVWGAMAQKAFQRHPETAFFSIVGDLVSTGLNRDEWDELFQYSGEVFWSRPLMPIPGNHDSQDGLGAWMYREQFSLPTNGPEQVPAEMTYAFTYQNALYLMMDVTQPIAAQTAWMEKQLRDSKAQWKFVMLHFPPYNFVEPYDEIVAEWGTLFDKYHVDMVMSGHMHYYLRTKPMHAQKAVASPAQGTIYTMSISIEGKQDTWPAEEYALVRYPDGPLYQHLRITGNKLEYRCLDPEGNVKDQLTIVK